MSLLMFNIFSGSFVLSFTWEVVRDFGVALLYRDLDLELIIIYRFFPIIVGDIDGFDPGFEVLFDDLILTKPPVFNFPNWLF